MATSAQLESSHKVEQFDPLVRQFLQHCTTCCHQVWFLQEKGEDSSSVCAVEDIPDLSDLDSDAGTNVIHYDDTLTLDSLSIPSLDEPLPDMGRSHTIIP